MGLCYPGSDWRFGADERDWTMPPVFRERMRGAMMGAMGG